MTMPHLMNCEHLADGWCLDCVGALHAKAERLEEDAGRYRWLRCTQNVSAMYAVPLPFPQSHCQGKPIWASYWIGGAGERLDAAIDAIRQP